VLDDQRKCTLHTSGEAGDRVKSRFLAGFEMAVSGLFE